MYCSQALGWDEGVEGLAQRDEERTLADTHNPNIHRADTSIARTGSAVCEGTHDIERTFMSYNQHTYSGLSH